MPEDYFKTNSMKGGEEMVAKTATRVKADEGRLLTPEEIERLYHVPAFLLHDDMLVRDGRRLVVGHDEEQSL